MQESIQLIVDKIKLQSQFQLRTLRFSSIVQLLPLELLLKLSATEIQFPGNKLFPIKIIKCNLIKMNNKYYYANLFIENNFWWKNRDEIPTSAKKNIKNNKRKPISNSVGRSCIQILKNLNFNKDENEKLKFKRIWKSKDF